MGCAGITSYGPIILWSEAVLRTRNQREDHPKGLATRANIPVEVVEERQEVEAEFQEALLFVAHERPEDFGCVEQVVIVDDSARVRERGTYLLAL